MTELLGNQDSLTPFMGLGPAPFFCLGEEVNRMSSSPFGLFFAGKVLGEEVDIMSSSPSCLFLLEVFLSLCLGEEVDIMSSSPSCQFLLVVILYHLQARGIVL